MKSPPAATRVSLLAKAISFLCFFPNASPIENINSFRFAKNHACSLNPNKEPERLPLSLKLLDAIFNKSSLTNGFSYIQGVLHQNPLSKNQQRFSPQFLTNYDQLHKITSTLAIEPDSFRPSWSYHKNQTIDANMFPKELLAEFSEFAKLAYTAGNLVSIPFHFQFGQNRDFGIRNLPAARRNRLFVGEKQFNLNGQGALFIEWLKRAQGSTSNSGSFPISFEEWCDWMCITDEIKSLYGRGYETYKQIFSTSSTQEKHSLAAEYIQFTNRAIKLRGEIIFEKITN